MDSKFFIGPANIIKAGSLTCNEDLNVHKCLTNVENMGDIVNAITHSDEQPQKMSYPKRPLSGDFYCGFETKMKNAMQAEPCSLFKTLMEEFKETMYGSYWHCPLGKTADQTPGLPRGMNPEVAKFGIRTDLGVRAGELISPNKLPGQVIVESELAHELYRKTHGDYYAGEQINRNYDNPKLDKCLIWGCRYPHDPAGQLVRRTMNWFNQDSVTAASDIQAAYKERTQPLLNKSLCLTGHIKAKGPFGKASNRELYGVGELLRNCEPSTEKMDLYEYLTHINGLRLGVGKKMPRIDHRDFMASMQLNDTENTGMLPLEQVYEVCLSYGISGDKPKLEALLSLMGILTSEGSVDYFRFTEVINPIFEFPELKKLEDIPKEVLQYESTAQAAGKDLLLRKPYEKLPRIPSCFGPSQVQALISPSLFTQYSLSHEDFLKPRDEKYMQNLFERIGVKLTHEQFKSIWSEGLMKDNTGGVCIETFRSILDEITFQNYQLVNE